MGRAHVEHAGAFGVSASRSRVPREVDPEGVRRRQPGPPADQHEDRAGDSTWDAAPVREVSITGDSIRLGQLLKLADAVDVGGDVKQLLATGEVTVNGEVETRRGRQLLRGDEVSTRAEDLRVV